MLIKNKNNITLPDTISTSNNNVTGSENINNSAENFNWEMITLNIRNNFIMKNTRFIRINSKDIRYNIKTNNKISTDNKRNMRMLNFFLNLSIGPHNKLSFTNFFTFNEKRDLILRDVKNHKLN